MMYYYANQSQLEIQEIRNQYICTACVKYFTQNQANQCVIVPVCHIISDAVLP
jgi:Zn finger protein HypA/HybF involved in hydrogenase expression